jgi:hypothetical protein
VDQAGVVLLDGVLKFLGHECGFLLTRSLEYDDEFVSAVAGDDVGIPDGREEDAGNVAQDLVAALVAEIVVDWFEAIEIEAKDGERVGTSSAADGLAV